MFRWIPYTFIRISIYFIAGIIAGIFFPDILPFKVAATGLVALVCIYVACYLTFRFSGRSWFNLGFVGLPAVLLAGYVHLLTQTESRDPRHVISIGQPIQAYQIVVNSYSEERGRSWRTEGVVMAVRDSSWSPCKGKVMLYFSKDDFPEPFRYGDVLVVRGQPERVAGPMNPGEFDYRQFLSYKNIYHQDFLRGDDVRLVGSDPPSNVMAYAIDARLWADATLKKYVSGEREQAIASALVLGVTDGLDNEILSAYSATGAMHVLAVSGLHVSIIYMLLVWLLKPLQRSRWGQWVLAFAGLTLLWAYAFITGLSPSVLRAVTMFSFLAVARPTRQTTNIYNTLAASAFCILMVDPYLIMSVGFQLSYLAVIGIVYLEPRLSRLWEPRSWLADKVWRLSTVSIAAQIATFAPGLLYFHQFPNYFLVANLLVIPVSFVVLILGLGVLAVSAIHVLAVAAGTLLSLAISLLNLTVFSLGSMPYSVVGGIYINATQCFLIMAIVVAFILMFEHRKFRYIVAAFFFTIVFVIFDWVHLGRHVKVASITIYSVRGQSAIDLIDRGHAYFFADSALLADDQRIGYHIRPNRQIAGATIVIERDHPFVRDLDGARIIRWKHHTIIQVMADHNKIPSVIRPDLIVVSHGAVKDFLAFADVYPETPIILDGSNPVSYARRFIESVEATHPAIYDVSQDGAFNFIVSEENT